MARKSRRKKSSPKSNPMPVIIGALAAVALLAAAFIILTRDDEVSNITPLAADTYYSSPDSLRGSTFEVKGEVMKKLYYKEGVTQLVQVSYQGEPLSIEVPDDIDGPNINTKQEYTFVVKAKSDAWLVASSYTDK